MVKRSPPQHQIDDRAFPVRLLILVPGDGFGQLLGAGPGTLDGWLDREVGRGDYARHSAGVGSVAGRDVIAVYFRHPSAALRFLDAFPGLELADGTALRGYTSPALPFGRQ